MSLMKKRANGRGKTWLVRNEKDDKLYIAAEDINDECRKVEQLGKSLVRLMVMTGMLNGLIIYIQLMNK